MKSNIDSFCRSRRSYSISPSVSFDNGVHLTEIERKEKNYYGATVKDTTNEIFLAFDDIIKHINHCLVTNLRPALKGDMTPEEIETLIHRFLDLTFKEFTYCYDKAEIKSQRFFSLDEIKKDLADYLLQKQKNKLNPFQVSSSDNVQQFSDKSIAQKFNKEKETYFNLVRSNLKLQLEIDMEKKIAGNLEKNEGMIKDSFEVIKNELDTRIDFSRLDKNLDIMMEQFTAMNKELDEFN